VTHEHDLVVRVQRLVVNLRYVVGEAADHGLVVLLLNLEIVNIIN
jgi:hypothetical protein